MRVIAGRLKGRRLMAPSWEGLRPTSDKLRETLFNILAPRIQGARVVDACAGTGALGIEALSRGARDVTFIEQDRRAEALIATNLEHCGVTTGYTMVRADVVRALASLRAGPPGAPGDHARALYDIVLVDPPYGYDPAKVADILAAASALLAPDGLLVLEHARRVAAPVLAGEATADREVVSGDSALTFYQRTDAERHT